MKKIVDHCSWGPDGKYIPDAVKLRLRGRGSGYKEGPYNRGNKIILTKSESEENLHLCVSSKYYDKYRHASILVHELLVNVYEEYKRFCERNYKTPITNLTIQKVECISSRRNNATNSMI